MDELSVKEKETLSQLFAKADETDIIKLLVQNGYQVSATDGEKQIEFQGQKKECVIVDTENEWEALYINGKLVLEEHSLSTTDMIKEIGIASYHFQDIQRKTLTSEGWNWWDEHYPGGTPETLDEIPSAFLK